MNDSANEEATEEQRILNYFADVQDEVIMNDNENPIVNGVGGTETTSEEPKEPTLKTVRFLQTSTSTSVDQRKGSAIDLDAEFWVNVSALRNTEYGIAMWCIGWNVVGLCLASDKAWRFIPSIILGIGFALSGCRTNKISKERTYKSLFVLIPIILFQVIIGLLIMQQSASEMFDAFTVEFTGPQLLRFDGEVASVMSIGNVVLMCFICYCNFLALKLVCDKIGACFDTLTSTTEQCDNSSNKFAV